MCYYSSHTVVVTSSSLDIRVALSKLFYLYILFYTTPPFFPCLRKYLYVYRQKLAATRSLHLLFLCFIIRLSNFTQSITVEHQKNTSSYNTPRLLDACPSCEGKNRARLASRKIRSIIVAFAT